MSQQEHVVRAFCVGQAKAGTASVHSLLDKHFRAAHEPERAETLAALLRKANGGFADGQFDEFLAARDRRLNLEFDIAWANQFMMEELVRVFPEAKFIVLVRDPPSWLQSIIGHLFSRKVPSDVRAFLDWWFRPRDFPHSGNDRVLADHGVYSISAYLHAWNRHVEASTRWIPESRRILIRTHELDASHERLANFLSVRPDRLDSERGHVNRSTWNGVLTELVDAAFIDDQTMKICGENLKRYFPEIDSPADASRL